MTNENLNDLRTYQYAGIASQLYEESQDPISAGISLEKLAKDLNCSDDLKPFIEGTLASKEGIERATVAFANKYQKAYKNATIGDLWDLYGSSAELNEKEKSIYSSIINPIQNSKLEDLKKDFNKLKKEFEENMKGEGEYNSEQLLGVQKKLRDYQDALGIIGLLEQYHQINLIEPIQKESMKRKKKAIKSNLVNLVGGFSLAA